MWGKTIELLEFIGMPPKLAATLLSIIIGFSLALAIIPTYLSIKNLNTTVIEMQTTVVQKVDSILGNMNKINHTQQILIEYIIDGSITSEYTTNQLINILKEVAKEDRVKIIIHEKQQAINQYQLDHLPHYKEDLKPPTKFSIGVKPSNQ